MVKDKNNKTIRHPTVMHIIGYEKYKKIQICMNTYPAIMHMHMKLDN